MFLASLYNGDFKLFAPVSFPSDCKSLQFNLDILMDRWFVNKLKVNISKYYSICYSLKFSSSSFRTLFVKNSYYNISGLISNPGCNLPRWAQIYIITSLISSSMPDFILFQSILTLFNLHLKIYSSNGPTEIRPLFVCFNQAF